MAGSKTTTSKPKRKPLKTLGPRLKPTDTRTVRPMKRPKRKKLPDGSYDV